MVELQVVAHELGGSGPLLLMLHANGFHGRVFKPMADELRGCFRCVGLDLPGFGAAPAPPLEGPRFSEQDLVAAVCRYVEREGITGAYCFGHSLGGTLACLLQLQRPATFAAMYLYEPVITPSAWPSGQGAAPVPLPASSSSSNGAGADAWQAGQGGAASSAPTAGITTAATATAAATAATTNNSPPAAAAAAGPSLASLARRRQWRYPSTEAAIAALGSKPPLKLFRPDALQAYLACGGTRPDPAHHQATDASACGSGSPLYDGPVVLSAAPEHEARIFELLHPPPRREWARLAAGGCRVAFAGCPPRPGLHSQLAVFAGLLAEEVPGAVLHRFHGLHHLGPMEDPAAVARDAAAFLLRDDAGCTTSSSHHAAELTAAAAGAAGPGGAQQAGASAQGAVKPVLAAQSRL